MGAIAAIHTGNACHRCHADQIADLGHRYSFATTRSRATTTFFSAAFEVNTIMTVDEPKLFAYFLHHDFRIYENKVGDTAFYDPVDSVR